jgi:hypothetical protein
VAARRWYPHSEAARRRLQWPSMRIKLSKASIVFAVLAILVGMPLLLSTHRIRPPYLALIKEGMTEAEVDVLLGAKAGDYDGYGPNGRRGMDPSLRLLSKKWCSRRGWIECWFDQSGRVARRPDIDDSMPVSWWTKITHRFLPPPNLKPDERGWDPDRDW